ncbi:MAG: glycosyltransferase [Calditrichaeota bacterium]|nr:MAG: glycosyltransferase [Calditrichota bacterium]
MDYALQDGTAKKILVAWFSFTLNGGIGRFIHLARVLKPFGHQVQFCSLVDDTETPWPELKGQILTLNEALKEQWDAVMIPGAGESAERLAKLNLLRQKNFGIRVQHILNDPSLYARFEKANYALDPHIVVINNEHWELKHLRKLRGEAFHYLIGAVDTERFFPHPFRNVPTKDQPIRIGALGAKNLSILLEAFQHLGDNFELHLFGPLDQTAGEALLALARQGRAKYWGPLFGEALAQFYHQIDLFVSVETRAGWCNAAAEAMACGVPCVASRHGTLSFARHMHTALVLEKISAQAVVDAVNRLVSDASLWKGLACRGARKMRAFSWHHYASQLLQIVFQPRINSYFRIPEYGLFGKWDPELRLMGLKPLMEKAEGCSVLDLGAAEGVIAAWFARHGARIIHGFEMVPDRIPVARRLLSQFDLQSLEYHQAAIGRWSDFLKQFQPVLLDRYDIVLFLGLYHHLNPAHRKDVLRGALERARRWFAIRTPRHLVEADKLIELITGNGFRLIAEEDSKPEENMGWLGIFERNETNYSEKVHVNEAKR